LTGRVRFTETEHTARLVNRRIVAAAIVMVVMVAALLSRLAYLQIVRGEHYSTLSQNNRVKVLPIAPPRGLIFSRDGAVVAENKPSYVLALDTAKIPDLKGVVHELQRLLGFPDEQVEDFFREVRIRGLVDEVALSSNLSEEQLATFAVHSHDYPGVRIDARSSRYYPEGELWAHVVGYVGRISEDDLAVIDKAEYRGSTHIGKAGVEKTYEALLHGKTGYQQVEINAQGRILRVLAKTPPEPGRDIYLTIDAALQRTAAELLKGQRGAVVAIDPQTGAVLAFVSSPSFDPNLFVNGIGAKSYAELRDSPDRPLFNRALQGQYPSGSTIKPFVALAGLQSGVRVATEATWCPGWYRLPGDARPYRDWKKGGHGHVDLIRAIAESCDVYFYNLAHDLGIDRLWSFMRQFGFGAPTGIDIPNEAAGIYPSSEWKRRARGEPWYAGETLSVGIGQGYTLVTPLQLAFATAVLARHGTGITPRVAGQIEDPLAHEATEPEIYERELVRLESPEYWDLVIQGMQEVVHGARGTARRYGQDAAYRFAGKTGTAQVVQMPAGRSLKQEEMEERLRDHALFIAFAPVEQPEIALAILVENGMHGSSAAAPIARTLFDQYLQDRLSYVQSAARE
jgi:penicillin-binding protein 2